MKFQTALGPVVFSTKYGEHFLLTEWIAVALGTSSGLVNPKWSTFLYYEREQNSNQSNRVEVTAPSLEELTDNVVTAIYEQALLGRRFHRIFRATWNPDDDYT